jgi:hypothetical protein
MRTPILGVFMKRSRGIEMMTVMDASVEAKSPQDYRRVHRPIRRSLAWLFLCAGVACIGPAQLSAQAPVSGLWPLVLIPNGETVYDVVNHVTWLTDANLPARQSFGISLCDGTGPYGSDPILDPCINGSGIMDYLSAAAWILAMNKANYLGHSNWQLPTTPSADSSCAGTGTDGNSFGFGCNANAMGYLYYKALGFHALNTAVPILANRVGPFRNFQPDRYWSISSSADPQNPIANFDFLDGSQGGGTGGDFHYVLPMIQDKIPPAAKGGLQVNLDGQTVHDPMAGVTWLADANLAASDTLGLPRCQTPTTPMYCVAQDGSMNDASAGQFISNMNAYDHGAGYLGQTDWQLPPVSTQCPTLGCVTGNPMGILFYIQFGLRAGQPVVEPPDIAVGPFLHLWPSTYWSCAISNTQTPIQAPIKAPIQAACDSTGANAMAAEFGFSFSNGYLGTARQPAYRFVTAYYVGCGLPEFWCSLLSGF